MLTKILDSPINTIALAKSLREDDVKAVRKLLQPGQYDIDATIKLKGSMSVGVNYTSNIVAKIDTYALLAHALNKLNVATIEAFVRECVIGETVLEPQGEELKEQVEEAIRKIKGTTATPCMGRVSPRVVVEISRDKSMVRETKAAA